MQNLAGEILLASTGIRIALEPGPVKFTKRHVKNADQLEDDIGKKAKAYFDAEGFIGSDAERPPFDYERLLDLLAPEPTPARILENVQGWPDQVLADAYAGALGAAWGYLHQKLPKRSRDTYVGEKMIRPPDLVLAPFRRAYDVVERPISVLESLCEGTLTKDQVATLRQVYPALYALMAQQLLEAIPEAAAKKGADWEPSYQKDRMLKVFLETDSMTPALRRMLQGEFEKARGESKEGNPSAKVAAAKGEYSDPSSQTQKLEAR